MSQVSTIREMWQNGYTITDISKAVNVDPKTVNKYRATDDFNKNVQSFVKTVRNSKIDLYKSEIIKMLEEETQWFHKQRYTAKRIYEILLKKYKDKDFSISYNTIARFVKNQRKELRRKDSVSEGGTLALVWNPGEAQCDFGEADYYDKNNTLIRGKYLLVSFPYSNRIIGVFMPGENCECVCQALQYIFERIERVPNSILFDNATGIGKRIGSTLKENEGFTRFKMHYGFIAKFANPYSGFEKGNVENAVGSFRRNEMVPPLKIDTDLYTFNFTTMLDLTFSYRLEEKHHLKKTPISELFKDDFKAMHYLPQKPFRVSKITTMSLNNVGSFIEGESHRYVLGPDYSGAKIIVEKTAWEIITYELSGKEIKTFKREYGQEHTDSHFLEAELKRIIKKTRAWDNSSVRMALCGTPLRDYIDTSDEVTRRKYLIALNKSTQKYGFGDTLTAFNVLMKDGHIPSEADLNMYCSRIQSFPVNASENSTGVNLSMFDQLIKR